MTKPTIKLICLEIPFYKMNHLTSNLQITKIESLGYR